MYVCGVGARACVRASAVNRVSCVVCTRVDGETVVEDVLLGARHVPELDLVHPTVEELDGGVLETTQLERPGVLEVLARVELGTGRPAVTVREHAVEEQTDGARVGRVGSVLDGERHVMPAVGLELHAAVDIDTVDVGTAVGRAGTAHENVEAAVRSHLEHKLCHPAHGSENTPYDKTLAPHDTTRNMHDAKVSRREGTNQQIC